MNWKFIRKNKDAGQFSHMIWFTTNTGNKIKPKKILKAGNQSYLLNNFINSLTQKKCSTKSSRLLRFKMRGLLHGRVINYFQPIGCLNILLIYIY